MGKDKDKGKKDADAPVADTPPKKGGKKGDEAAAESKAEAGQAKGKGREDAKAQGGKPDKGQKAEKSDKADKGDKAEKSDKSESTKPADAAAAGAEGAPAAGAEGAPAEGGEAKRKRRKFARSGFQADGKKIAKAREQVDKNKRFDIPEALDLLQRVSPKRKFDETINLVMKLGVDPRKQGQALRGSLALPKGIGKTKKVIAFAEGPIAEAARQAGATEVGGEDLAKKIEGGWLDFDVAIAHPAAMKFISKLGKVLGPSGKMPTPKAGTVTPDVATAVREFAAGKIEFRTDDYGNIHVPMGKRSFKKEDLVANLNAFIDHIKALKPTDVKGVYIQKMSISSTMGPAVALDTKESVAPAP